MEWKGMGHQMGSIEDILDLTSLEEKSDQARFQEYDHSGYATF
jgi:hypothetical protein